MKNKYKVLSFGLLLSLLLTMVPLQVFAAETTKELTIIASSENEAKKQAEKRFKETLQEKGKKFQLLDIRYEVVETKYLKVIEEKKEVKEEPKKTITENGIKYTLKSFEKEERNKDGINEQVVTAYEDYDHAISIQDVPTTKTVKEVNRATGEEQEVVCQFTEITSAGTTTVDKTMVITFTDYDSAYYDWNGELLAHNDEVPPLKGHESSLLDYVGASEGSIVTDFWWSGEPYTSNGVLCRDAATTVRQEIPVYRANYEGTMTIPKETIYKAVYETPDTKGKKEVTVKATAVYEEDRQLVQILIAAGVGLVILIPLIVMILMIIAKKKKEKSEEK